MSVNCIFCKKEYKDLKSMKGTDCGNVLAVYENGKKVKYPDIKYHEKDIIVAPFILFEDQKPSFNDDGTPKVVYKIAQVTDMLAPFELFLKKNDFRSGPLKPLDPEIYGRNVELRHEHLLLISPSKREKDASEGRILDEQYAWTSLVGSPRLLCLTYDDGYNLDVGRYTDILLEKIKTSDLPIEDRSVLDSDYLKNMVGELIKEHKRVIDGIEASRRGFESEYGMIR